ncbi:MAG: pyrroline-5-carboxylate reductase [Firmicutes bacterium]|nr:pyrroline-5-carboxylate reductase [Bacillota bacterium]
MSIYGFIGTGHMGSAMAKAASKGGVELLLANRTVSRAEALAAEIGGQVVSNEEVARRADFIFLGVKPQGIDALMDELRPVLLKREEPYTLVSMLAGKTVKYIRDLAGEDCPVIRLMPNTPVAIGEGMVLYASDGVAEEAMTGFLEVMKSGGRFRKMSENLIDAASSVTGCGPAFVDLFIESLADGAVVCGIPRAQALELAAQMVAGSAKLLLESGKHPGELKDAVCSPGGSTIEGVKKLEEGAFRASVINAVIASCEKNKKL